MRQQSQKCSTYYMQQDPTTTCSPTDSATLSPHGHRLACPCIYNPFQPDHQGSHAGCVARWQQSRTSSTEQDEQHTCPRQHQGEVLQAAEGSLPGRWGIYDLLPGSGRSWQLTTQRLVPAGGPGCQPGRLPAPVELCCYALTCQKAVEGPTLPRE